VRTRWSRNRGSPLHAATWRFFIKGSAWLRISAVAHAPSHHRERAPAEESPSASGVDALAHGEVAEQTGPHTARLFERILAEKLIRRWLSIVSGIIRLAEQYSAARMEAAADRALRTGACRYQNVKSILKNSLDQQPLAERRLFSPPPMTTSEAPVLQ